MVYLEKSLPDLAPRRATTNLLPKPRQDLNPPDGSEEEVGSLQANTLKSQTKTAHK